MRLLISIRFLMYMNGEVPLLLVTWLVYTSGYIHTRKKSAQYVYRNSGRDNSQFNLQQVHSPSKVLSQKGYLHILHSLSSLRHFHF